MTDLSALREAYIRRLADRLLRGETIETAAPAERDEAGALAKRHIECERRRNEIPQRIWDAEPQHRKMLRTRRASA